MCCFCCHARLEKRFNGVMLFLAAAWLRVCVRSDKSE
jgi:hypothetical protein